MIVTKVDGVPETRFMQTSTLPAPSLTIMPGLSYSNSTTVIEKNRTVFLHRILNLRGRSFMGVVLLTVLRIPWILKTSSTKILNFWKKSSVIIASNESTSGV